MTTFPLTTFPLVEITVSYSQSVKKSERPIITNSQQAYEYLRRYWNDDVIDLYEEFKVLLLNSANRVLGVYEASRGGLTGTVADPRLILGVAIKTCATAMIVAHNHPSGGHTPSRADEQITEKLKQAGALFDIRVTDHLIISADDYYSFADEGRV
ncbi:JAB domain-containing protein [Sediminibacterium ginsengisoli]|uniref:DNA repair protein radc n=1 Tax=Sediminibacterium ginsengisoli TaxID=413434 RepID=A0A1T4NFE8_9BACT|nr:JAB domain-containing protein [Sediminibacterium ginsengisoli]SJZ78071.1 DNA repair protein radc [Sediminibacterium ginsengisoli]